MRGLAEMENLRTRTTRDIAKAKDFGIQKFSKDLITVADTLELALNNAPDNATGENADPQTKALFEGMEGTAKQMQKVFSSHGLAVVDAVDQEFDPNTMEAMFQVPDLTKDPNTVAVVHRTGYTLNSRVIRPAMVGVVHHP